MVGAYGMFRVRRPKANFGGGVMLNKSSVVSLSTLLYLVIFTITGAAFLIGGSILMVAAVLSPAIYSEAATIQRMLAGVLIGVGIVWLVVSTVMSTLVARVATAREVLES